jgi:hypothetical protein
VTAAGDPGAPRSGCRGGRLWLGSVVGPLLLVAAFPELEWRLRTGLLPAGSGPVLWPGLFVVGFAGPTTAVLRSRLHRGWTRLAAPGSAVVLARASLAAIAWVVRGLLR